MSEVQQKVVEIIVDKLGVKESEVVPEASFTNHLGADSLDTVELIMEFEKAFDIQIPDEDAEKIATVTRQYYSGIFFESRERCQRSRPHHALRHGEIQNEIRL